VIAATGAARRAVVGTVPAAALDDIPEHLGVLTDTTLAWLAG